MVDETAAEAARARAREFLRTRGTGASVAVVREGVRDAFGALDAFLTGVPATQVACRPPTGDWCIQEIADHLLESHRPGLDELRCLLAGQRPPGAPIPASLQSKAPLLRPWPWLCLELSAVHAGIVAALEAVPDGFVTPARAPLVMVVPVKDANGGMATVEWVEDLDWKAYALVWRLHVIDHLRQARAVLAALPA